MLSRTISLSRRMLLAAVLVALVGAVSLAIPAFAQAAPLKVGSVPDAKSASVTAAAKKTTKAATTKKKVVKIRTAKQWRNISKYKGGTFKIMKNIKLPSEKYYLTISKSKKYAIDLNGKKVATAYKGVALRTVCPLHVAKGTVVVKSSKKNKGVLYSTETAAVTVSGKAKFYLKSGSIVNDAVEFRSDITSAIFLTDSAKCYLQGASKVRSIGNGVALFGKSRLSATGSPYVRAGANEYKGQFTHYGSGISIASKEARIKLKGGSYGTKASPDAALASPAGTFTYAQSANYPILDQFGFALASGIAAGCKVVDANGAVVEMRGSNLSDYYNGTTAPSWDELLAQFGMASEKRYTTNVKSADGYYTVYVKKK